MDDALEPLPTQVTVIAVEPHGGTLWRAPACPFCEQTMTMLRSPFTYPGIPSYYCPTHGNADMVFVSFDQPPARMGVRGAPYTTVVALPIHHYEGATAVVYTG